MKKDLDNVAEPTWNTKLTLPNAALDKDEMNKGAKKIRIEISSQIGSKGKLRA